MNSAEKLERMLRLEKPADRSEIPYMPQIITWAGTASGISQKDMIQDIDKNIEALDKTFELIGKPDAMMCNSASDTIFIMGLEARIPGRELGDNELYQFVETDKFLESDGKEYDRILQMGWQNWYGEYLCRIQNPPFQSPEQLFARFGQMGQNMGKMAMHFGRQGIEPITHSALGPVFDTLSMVHSLGEFCYDLYDYPEKVKAVIQAGTPGMIEQTIGTIKQVHGSRAGIFAMRSSATFISPDVFEEFVWPALKQMVGAFWAAGITSVVHADANWVPMMKFFKQLPKGSVHFELDGDSNIYQTYEALEGWHSIRGDVPATMLAYGTPDEVAQYCEKLITDIGMKGGLMLGSGCEVPLNAKMENVRAMGDSLKK